MLFKEIKSNSSNTLLNAANWLEFKKLSHRVIALVYSKITQFIIDDVKSVANNSLLPLKLERFENLRNTLQSTLRSKLDVLQRNSALKSKEKIEYLFTMHDIEYGDDYNGYKQQKSNKGIVNILTVSVLEVFRILF